MIYKGGNIYEGEWKNGDIHGKGKLLEKDGSFYDGDWKNFKKDGIGK